MRAPESVDHDQPSEQPSNRFILDAAAEELRDWMAQRGHPAYRARQVLDWVIRQRAESFETMSNLPLALRRQLGMDWSVLSTRVSYHGHSPDGTDKLLLECHDKRRIECVLMVEEKRRTACISTQVGCGMGCVFCASGLKGFERNLSAAEIVEQVLRLRNLLPEGDSITHIVVMGMGESLANLDQLIPALDRLCSAGSGLGLSQRRVTISTVGLPEKIRKLASLDRQYHLAVSLHAATDDLRDRLVPISAKIGIRAVLDAADFYFQTTGRQVTYEYVLLHGVNDRPADARALAQQLQGRKAHVNLIPYNPVAGLPFQRPGRDAVLQFATLLRDRGVSTTVRKTKGQAIEAACGQLRRRLSEDPAAATPASFVPAPSARLALQGERWQTLAE
jgi:23S rRNA (adenine2503-C2)-methyltransferase